MSEEMKSLSESELEAIAGGGGHRKHPCTRVHKTCQECAIIGKMNVPIYEYKGKLVCFQEAHVYEGNIDNYIGIDIPFQREAAEHCK